MLHELCAADCKPFTSMMTAARDAGLAVVKYKLNLWDEVQDLFARAYDIQSTQLGQDNPELALTMSHSAGLLKAMNKDADAETVWRTVSQHCLVNR